MSPRRTLVLPVVALVAAVTLLAGACGSDDNSADKKTTTTEKSSAGRNGYDGPTTTISAAEFSAGIKKGQDEIAAAGNDPCKVMEAFQTVSMSMGAPTTKDQRKQAALLALQFYRAIADAAPAELSSEAGVLRKTADKIEAEGEKENWSEEFMKSPKAITDNKDFETASTKLMTTLGAKCSPSSGAAGTDGTGAGDGTQSAPNP